MAREPPWRRIELERNVCHCRALTREIYYHHQTEPGEVARGQETVPPGMAASRPEPAPDLVFMMIEKTITDAVIDPAAGIHFCRLHTMWVAASHEVDSEVNHASVNTLLARQGVLKQLDACVRHGHEKIDGRADPGDGLIDRRVVERSHTRLVVRRPPNVAERRGCRREGPRPPGSPV